MFGRWMAGFARYALAATLTTLLGACATSLSSVQPARTAPVSHLALTTAVAANVPVGATSDTVDDLRGLRELPTILREEDIERLATSITAVAQNPPLVDPFVTLAYGVHQRLEIGARVGGSHIGGSARVQFLRVAPGIYGAVGLGVSAALSTFPISRFSDRLVVEQFRRIETSIPLTFGYSAQSIHLWAGPKLLFSRVRHRGEICVRNDDACNDHVAYRGRASLRYVAAQLGVAFGKRRVFFGLELNIGRVRGDGSVEGQYGGDARRYERGVKGRVVQPAFGLIIWI